MAEHVNHHETHLPCEGELEPDADGAPEPAEGAPYEGFCVCMCRLILQQALLHSCLQRSQRPVVSSSDRSLQQQQQQQHLAAAVGTCADEIDSSSKLHCKLELVVVGGKKERREDAGREGGRVGGREEGRRS